MRNFINLVESLSDDGFTNSSLLDAMYLHNITQIDPDMTREELSDRYNEVRSHLNFPMTIYRALAFDDFGAMFDAQHDNLSDLDDDARADLERHIRSIDFNSIGVSWTWDRKCAVAGGAVGGGDFNHDGCHVVLAAQISADQCDLLITLHHNLGIFEEEKEIRVKPNVPIKITGMYPDVGLRLPINANSGPDDGSHEAVLYDLRLAMKSQKPE